MKRILGIVVLYNPDYEDVLNNIQTYIPYLDKCVIWNNTPGGGDIALKISRHFSEYNCTLIEHGENEGLAIAYNKAIDMLEAEDYDYLLTMDQDSAFLNNHARIYFDTLFADDNPGTGIFSPNINTHNPNKRQEQLRTAISSGAVYKAATLKDVGYFDTDYFIYMLDIEYSYRAKTKGWSIVRICDVQMQHSEGYATTNKIGLKVNNYSAQSTYYIIRNTLKTWKKYPKYSNRAEKAAFWKYKIVYRCFKLIFEQERLLKLKAITIGLLHGLSQRPGKYLIK